MEKELRRSFWSDAAKKGGIIGLLIVILILIDGIFRLNGAKGVISLMEFLVIAVLLYRFGRDRALRYGNEGFTYGQSMGYIMAMMLFAGFIYGIGEFLLQNYIAPDYYDEKFEQAWRNMPVGLLDPDTTQGQEALKMATTLRRNIIYIIFVSVFNMLFLGGLIGLITSAFIRRRPVIFDGTDSDTTE